VQGHPFVIRLTLIIPLSLLVIISARAQNNPVHAFVRSYRGDVKLYSNSGSASLLNIKLNMQLEPDNMIVTGRNSQIFIELSDFSRITVMPNSRVVLKKFQFPNTARELLEIQLGRVIVKIHHPPGQPNPYNLSSPAASIAVRGTEFIVDVQFGGETLVLVREGLVEVWPRDNPDNKRLVSPGDRVTIQPGGRISSVFPTPNRSLESVTQKTGGDSGIFFSAFPDRHLDSLDNPAYATEFKDAQGRLLLLPSVSSPHHVDNVFVNGVSSNTKGLPPFDYDVSPQVTFFTPIPDTRFVIGGGISASHIRSLRVINEGSADYPYHNSDARKLNALNASIIAAYSFGEQGRTSVGIGIDRSSGKENRAIDYDSKSTIEDRKGFDYSGAYIARTRITLGLTRRLSESTKIGFYYRHSFNLSDQESLVQQDYNRREYSYPIAGGYQIVPAYSYFVAGRTDISASSSSSELGFRLRGSLTRKLFYGAQGSYLYERIRSREMVENQSATPAQIVAQPVSQNRYLGRSANLSAGLGFLLTSKILLNFDLAGSLFNTPRSVNQPVILGLSSVNYSYPYFALASSVYSQGYLRMRGGDVSTHMAAQANPWRNLILSTSVLMTFQRYSFPSRTMAVSIGTGWKFKPNLIAEYVGSTQYGIQGPSHAIRLRYTFNLGITNEK
jgi:FecR-like protein